ncbi:lysylphosphatidylglycerol synthase transmembrane domain-containing protein [Nitrosococcus wardiae]|uniref:Flippase-like domain-containing protein n=1 Tax=Nitrosococcus wardiae TaxID=1814290 RepID=A0A4P7C3B4_9GAMM|nr:lysylphosphatidylglycerol synthase transmembrane domain-containing protein [Nitrosococcus wardiae]QBQ55396.1 flippase-like domain-containing protein [Nitrosococcus wardiae]
MRRYWILVLLALGLGLAIPLGYGGLAVFERLSQVPFWLPLLTLGMIFIGWNFNAAKLRILVSAVDTKLSHKSALGTVMAWEFAFSATPAGSGGVISYVYLLNRYGVKTAHAAAVFAMELGIDLLFFVTASLIVVIKLSTSTTYDVHLGFILVAVLLTGGMGLMWVLAHQYRRLLRVLGYLLKVLKVSAVLRKRAARWMLRLRSGLTLLLGLPRRYLYAAYLLCIGHWLLRFSVLYVLLLGLGEDVPWPYLFITQVLILTVGHFTFLPGGTGGVELGFGAMLGPFLDSATLATALVLWRFATFYWYLIAGAPVFATVAGPAIFRTLVQVTSRKS